VIEQSNLHEENVKKLNAEINAVLSDPKVIKQHENLGATVAPGTVSEFAQMIEADNVKWGKVIRDNNISLD